MKSLLLSDVKSVSILERDVGTDIISISLGNTLAYPQACGYGTVVRIECQKGKAVSFLREYWGIDPDLVINAS